MDVENGTIQIPNNQLENIKNHQFPRNKKEAQSILGFFRFIRKFVSGFAIWTGGITKLLKEETCLPNEEDMHHFDKGQENSKRDLQT